MLIYVNITDRQTDGQTHQKYSSEPHKRKNPLFMHVTIHLKKNCQIHIFVKKNSKFFSGLFSGVMTNSSPREPQCTS